uniref:AAA+ ATPase domain-containing protein n=1 Tax=Oryza rufipogon TaxID=4529 RepID=A0A0E0MTC5_ORYRU
MEGKHVVMSAVGIGIGVGVGLGLASAPWAGGGGQGARVGVTVERVEQELRRLVVDGADSRVTFDGFPYYLSEQTRVLLTSAAYVHLKQADISQYTRNLAPASRAILLSGPAGTIRRQSSMTDMKLRSSESTSSFPKLKRNASTSSDMSSLASQGPPNNPASLRRASSWTFDEKILVQAVYKPPENENHLVSWNSQLEEDMKMIQFQDNRNHITEVLAENDLECDDLGSICLSDTMVLGRYIEEIVVSAVSYHLMNKKDPEYRNGKLLLSAKSMKLEAKRDASKVADRGIAPFAAKSETKPATLLPPVPPTAAAAPPVESKAEPEKFEKKDNPSPAAKAPEMPPDNEFEKRIRPEVIPANEIGVTFDDIGALSDIKESLQELVMLPLRRPDLFKGGLLKPCRGILLFGPPGTGKTMLAKAIANEAQASFINVSMSTITSKWFGEDEKNVRALFTLAAKVSPTIIFVDEVDSMLGQRNRAGEHEAMRKIKNEFMTHWDGLLSRPDQKILVLAATNRPFDLDEAIIRRFERRIMVGLPSLESRELILRSLLSKEKVDGGLDYKELATMTEGYSGSDLKNLCTTAAYRPVRELIQKERKKELEKKKREQGGNASDASKMKEKDETIILRPLNMKDLKEAKNQVAASFAAEGTIMGELKQWNELYGEGGSRKKQQLTYFL